MTRILIASTNPGKRVEIQEILAELTCPLMLPGELGLTLDVAETGLTYAENAALKARAYTEEVRAAGLADIIVLADDSGLEVDALDGAPGLHSARYHPKPGAKDGDRRAYLLDNLRGLPRPWTARFRCAVALINPRGEERFTEGVCEGEIISTERGSNGFGYDPVFYLPVRGLTMAELGSAEKNRVSHRARALQAALPILREWVTE